MSDSIIVIGSVNMDMVVKASHIPQPGETVLGGTFLMNPGGKGANQAIAAARLGGNVAFVGKVGDDVFGKQSVRLFDDEGVDTSGILLAHDVPSGVALITVDGQGENSIVVASGANAHLTPEDVEPVFQQYPNSRILLIQLETPMPTVEYAIQHARDRAMQIILNPAPVNLQASGILHLVDILTPNEREAALLSGVPVVDIESARQAAVWIQNQGVKHVILTLGKAGAVLLEGDEFYHIPAPEVEAVDTTAAGDVFNGALAVALAEGSNLKEAASFACRAAAAAVTKMGAQSSIPRREEVV